MEAEKKHEEDDVAEEKDEDWEAETEDNWEGGVGPRPPGLYQLCNAGLWWDSMDQDLTGDMGCCAPFYCSHVLCIILGLDQS